jgi:hypothetical protein
LLEQLHYDWIWLRTHELWLPEVWTKLVWHCGGNTHHGFLLLNSSYVFFGFWARFSAMASSMILAVEVWVFWVMILKFGGSSSPIRKTSSCTWFAVLVELWIFHIVDVLWILVMRTPCYSSITLPFLISLGHSSSMIFVKFDVFF